MIYDKFYGREHIEENYLQIGSFEKIAVIF